MARPFKIGDKVIVTGPFNELLRYDADGAHGRKGKIVEINELGVGALAEWAKKIPGITPKTKTYFVDLDNGPEFWLFDLHITLDLDALPYDEWVRARDWNKVYDEQSKKLMREIRGT